MSAMAPRVMPSTLPSAMTPAYIPPWAPSPMIPRRTFFSDMVSPFCGGCPHPGGGAEGEVSGGAERAVHQGWSPHRPYSGRWPAELALGEGRCQRARPPPGAAPYSSARSASCPSTCFVESGSLQSIVVLLVAHPCVARACVVWGGGPVL